MNSFRSLLLGRVVRRNVSSLWLAIGALVLLPLILPPHLESLATKILIFGLLASSLNLLYGYGGLFSLGHAAYSGTAAYTVGILAIKYEVASFWLLAPGALLAATLLAAIFGVLALRTAHVYFLLTTLALGELTFSVAHRWRSMTGADNGMAGIPAPDLGVIDITWSPITFYYFTLVIFLGAMVLLGLVINSPLGQALIGVRDNERRMQMLGFNTWRVKYIAFVLGGTFAGIAGLLLAYFTRIVVPADTGIATSGLILLMVIIGGSGTRWGPLVGAALVLLVQFYASSYMPERWPLILGAFYMLSVGPVRERLLATVRDGRRRFQRRLSH
jgi:branched-chain amino acid transport system permease protein